MKKTILIIGLGGLGSVTLELLARSGLDLRIIAADRDKVKCETVCNLARVGGMAQAYYPDIEARFIDLDEPATLFNTLEKDSPDIVLSTATRMTWWLPSLLPEKQQELLDRAGFGVWLPVHMSLTKKLMESLMGYQYEGIAITAPFPDVVNHVLSRVSLNPMCGVGNIDEIAPKVNYLASKKLGVNVSEIETHLVAHHSLEPYAFGEKTGATPPYFIRVYHKGKNVSEEVNADKLLFEPYPTPSGQATHFLTAGSTVKLIAALTARNECFLHLPAPNGLPGGYPVTVSQSGITMADTLGISYEEKLKINQDSHRFDGIETVENDGTVQFCEESAEIMKNELGYDCSKMAVSETEYRAAELLVKFKEYANKHKVSLSPYLNK